MRRKVKYRIMSVTPSKKKTSPEQLHYMVDFIAEHKILLHGKTKPSEANVTEKLSDELTTALNAIGSGPNKSKIQWKKTFIDWKCHTKKKARELVKSEKKTGGGEADTKKLTPAEDKLMTLLSWIAVRGTDVNELGLEYEVECTNEAAIEVLYVEEESGQETHVEINNIEPLTSTSKRPGQFFNSQIKRRKVPKEKTNNLRKAADAYALGQKETGKILEKLESLQLPNPENERFRQKELELKESELKIRLLEARNKTKELELRERELRIKEKEMYIHENKL